jgi:hypothetical protein
LSFRAGSEQRGECWLRKILFNLLGFSVVEKRQEKTICLKLLVYLLSYLAKLLRTCSPFLLLDVTEIKINERNISDFSSKYLKSRWEPKFLHIFPRKNYFPISLSYWTFRCTKCNLKVQLQKGIKLTLKGQNRKSLFRFEIAFKKMRGKKCIFDQISHNSI